MPTAQPQHSLSTEARLTAHWALQIPAGAASVLLENRKDDSHSNFGWVGRDDGLFTSHPLTAKGLQQLHVSLKPTDLTLAIWRRDLLLAHLFLEGHTLEEGLDWMQSELSKIGDVEVAFELRDYDMPSHPIADGAKFEVGELQSELRHLAGAYHRFTHAFSAVEASLFSAKRAGDSIEVKASRVWPHHFDLGGLLTVHPDPEPAPDEADSDDDPAPAPSAASGSAGEPEFSIGYGLSPGDGTFESAYLYVNRYPAPEATPQLADPSLGSWYTGDFTGFVVPGEEMAELTDPQLEQVLRDRIDALRQ